MIEGLPLPTKESIRRAAEKCPEAKKVLKELFPRVFSVCCHSFGNAIREGDIKEHKTGSPLSVLWRE